MICDVNVIKYTMSWNSRK